MTRTAFGRTLHDMNAAGLRRLLYAVDAAVATVLAVMWVSQARGQFAGSGQQVGAYVLAVAATAPFAVRRLAPRAVFVVLAASFATALVVGTAATGVGAAFAAYTVLVRHGRGVAGVVITVGYGLIVLAYLLLPDATSGTLFLDAITFAMVIALAELVRTRGAYAAIYEERAAQLNRERATLAQKAIDGERLRIARELHDVVAHAISLIAVQSSVGLERLRKEPDATARALATIETSSRGALMEMRRMLAILRRDDESLMELAPSSGLSDVPGLAREASAVGVQTRLVIEGERPQTVPPGVDLCGYRIVQEALTNAVKHAPGATARVSLLWQPDGLVLEVRDDGHGPGLLGRPEGQPAGHGLVGMRERVALFGGSLEAGPRTNGGYGVRARLPFEAPSLRTGRTEAVPTVNPA
jgi:signal transduction histidine kinase